MGRLLAGAAAALALISGQALAQSSVIVTGTVLAAGAGPVNSIAIGNASGVAQSNYPLQFGRPFLDGAIADEPQVLIDGSPIPTQADVKNRYPDGSVEFAVVAIVIPTIPASGSQTLTFQDQTAGDNTPLTEAQMAALLPPGTAITLTGPARVTGTVLTAAAIATTGTTPALLNKLVTAGGFTFDGQNVGPINLAVVTTEAGVASAIQAALPAGYLVTVVTGQIVIQGPAVTAAATPPAALGWTDLSAMLGLAAPMAIQAGGTGSADANAMLVAGACQPWTQGPIAQTMICADDSAAAAFDIGFGDGYKPVRPRFYATFWPGTSQVNIRAAGEIANTTAIEDVAATVTIALGGTTVYSTDLTGDAGSATPNLIQSSGVTPIPRLMSALSAWSRANLWLGGTPTPEIDIDPNLAYLESTRFIPNYDTSIVVPATAIAAQYAKWVADPNDLYEQADQEPTNPMGDEGAHPEIGPVPTWDVLWLYTGDWRARVSALGITDLSGAFPANLREGDPTRRLSRADPTGLNPETGLGHTISMTDRTTVNATSAYELINAARPADAVKIVGPYNANAPWTFDTEHVPAMWFVPYVLTGDPWYLNEMYMWAGFTALFPITPRGPGRGDYGVITETTPRGIGWPWRNRAEAAFAAPDADPEKAYFTYLTNDALADWEGRLGITGTPFDGTALKNWSGSQGDYIGPRDPKDPASTKVSPLGTWYATCDATSTPVCATALYYETAAGQNYWNTGAVGSFDKPWMDFYLFYALGRLKELGFAAEPLQAYSAQFLIGMINNSGEPWLVDAYVLPSEPSGGGWFPNWAALVGALSPGYLTATTTTSTQFSLKQGFTSELYSEGYPMNASTTLSYEAAEPGGSQAWSWLYQNAYLPALATDGTTNPKWFLLPRTDTNALPAITTATPPG